MSGGHWNRAGRRSGGNRPVPIPVGGIKIEMPVYSFQCFERRHGECHGKLEVAPGDCECDCHKVSPPKPPGKPPR